MLKIGIKNLEKYYGDRLVLKIGELNVYKGDRLGIVGRNGAGKTSLLEIIGGKLDYDRGDIFIAREERVHYISQMGPPYGREITGKSASIFNIDRTWKEEMSGGEKTKFKIAEALEARPSIILADEPTSNLDMETVDLIVEKFKSYDGTILLVSHNRDFLDKLCNKTLELGKDGCKLYRGNYSDYLGLKKKELERKEFEFREYTKEKSRLMGLKLDLKERSKAIRRTPKRMGNSEARLHRMGGQGNKKKLDNFAKSIETRIDQLEVKEKPIEEEVIRINILESSRIHSKILIEAKDITKSYGEKLVLKSGSFTIYNGEKLALLGANGSGKTSLIKMILGEEAGIKRSKNLKIGYFSQALDILDGTRSIIDNVMETSIYDENFSRLILARLLIKGEKVKGKASILSGGERVKLSLAKIILSDINFLILDEPTNYLDLPSLEVIEELLINYGGSILFVSHDRRFIENIATGLLILKDKTIKSFKGDYKTYLARKDNKKPSNKDLSNKLMLLELELGVLVSKLSIEEDSGKVQELDREYGEKLREINLVKKALNK